MYLWLRLIVTLKNHLSRLANICSANRMNFAETMNNRGREVPKKNYKTLSDPTFLVFDIDFRKIKNPNQ